MRGRHADQPLRTAGAPLGEADAALILLHGRGATPESILPLAREVAQPGVAFLAPGAAGGTWYPYSFLAPLEQNEPHLTEALESVRAVLARAEAAGIPPSRVVLTGFSQGACLAAEFVARHAQRFAGLAVFSGGLIGPEGSPRDYEGDLAGTPVFLGCSDVDPHIPLPRVRESSQWFRKLGGQVTEAIYPGMPHTIIQDEIDHLAGMIAALRRDSLKGSTVNHETHRP